MVIYLDKGLNNSNDVFGYFFTYSKAAIKALKDFCNIKLYQYHLKENKINNA